MAEQATSCRLPGSAGSADLGRKELPVRFCTLPARGSNLGELPAAERPTDPLDRAGDARCAWDLTGDWRRGGVRVEARGIGGGVMTISTDEAWSGDAKETAGSGLSEARGGTKCEMICSRTFCQPAASLTSPVGSIGMLFAKHMSGCDNAAY